MRSPAKLYVYWNLHRKCFSVRYKGKVIEHTDRIYLKDVEFKVSEKGRRRVLAERKKNVHAFVCGYRRPSRDYLREGSISVFPVKYNPYENDSFINRSTGLKITKSKCALLVVSILEPKTPRVYAYIRI